MIMAHGLPPKVFQFDVDREAAKTYLVQNPSLPFVIRKSSVEGKYAITYIRDSGEACNLLIRLPDASHDEYQVYSLKDGRETGQGKLQNLVGRLMRLKILQHIEEDTTKIAVLSIQSLDGQKIALTAPQVEEYARAHPGVNQIRDGHTGFAIAKVLGSPFAVVRSQGHREESNNILKNHIDDQGLLVITGHGRPGGSAIEGNYIDVTENNRFQQQIKRDPYNIVSSSMEAGLKSGASITILLIICYGAQDPDGNQMSFAHKLAREFAKKGISTTIVASNSPVLRFGVNAAQNNTLEFNAQVGIKPQDVHIFKTQVRGPELHPTITMEKPNSIIHLNKEGLSLVGQQGSTLLAPSKAKELAEQQRNSNLAKINKALDRLEEKVGTIDQHKSREAHTTATELLKQLRSAKAQLIQGQSESQFKLNCKKAIDSARPELEKDLGWGQYLKNLLKTLYNALARPFTSNPNTFYKMERPDSVTHVEQAEADLDLPKAAPGV